MVAVTDVQLFANNVTASLNSTVLSGDSSLGLQVGEGAAFPSPAAGEYFAVTVQNTLNGDIEVMYCTARSGDILTVQRAQEGTVALGFPANDSIVQMRVTAGTLEKLIQARFDGVDVNKYLRVQADGTVLPDVLDNIDGAIYYTRGAGWSGGGPAIVLGDTDPVEVSISQSGTIRGFTAIGNAASGAGTGSCVIDVRKTTLAGLPATGANSICGGNKPTIVVGRFDTDSALAGWTTSVAAGDVLTFVLESVSGFEQLSIFLSIEVPSGAVPKLLTTKGDLWGYDVEDARVAVGTNEQYLIADSPQPTGLRWGKSTLVSHLGDAETHTAGKGTAEVEVFSSSGVASINPALSNCFYLELVENVTALTIADGSDGQMISIIVQQDLTGSWTLAFSGANIQLVNGDVQADASSITHYSARWVENANGQVWVIAGLSGFVAV